MHLVDSECTACAAVTSLSQWDHGMSWRCRDIIAGHLASERAFPWLWHRSWEINLFGLNSLRCTDWGLERRAPIVPANNTQDCINAIAKLRNIPCIHYGTRGKDKTFFGLRQKYWSSFQILFFKFYCTNIDRLAILLCMEQTTDTTIP
jgi:hypothetical protein